MIHWETSNGFLYASDDGVEYVCVGHYRTEIKMAEAIVDYETRYIQPYKTYIVEDLCSKNKGLKNACMVPSKIEGY